MLAIITFGVGLISGMYIITQIEKGIDNNIKKNNESDRSKQRDSRRSYK